MTDSVGCPPILLLIFNRPDLTQKVFSRIRQAQPSKLFIAADGPRSSFPADKELCAQARMVVEQVDWECETHTLFRETNLGCKRAVSYAIEWFFDLVEEGIVLEDDCLPHPTFFRFCAELLDSYRNNDRVMMIGGSNFQQGNRRTPYSFYFSHFSHVWGWASWQRAWQHYDGNLTEWPTLRNTSWLNDIHDGSKKAAAYWQDALDNTYAEVINTWDYRWLYSIWKRRGLAIVPEVNLITNMGFDERATHTKSANRQVANLAPTAMVFPLRHPTSVIRHIAADQFTLHRIYLIAAKPNYIIHIVQKIKQVITFVMMKIGVYDEM